MRVGFFSWAGQLYLSWQFTLTSFFEHSAGFEQKKNDLVITEDISS